MKNGSIFQVRSPRNVRLLHTETSTSCHSQSTQLHTELHNCHGNGPSFLWKRMFMFLLVLVFPEFLVRMLLSFDKA